MSEPTIKDILKKKKEIEGEILKLVSQFEDYAGLPVKRIGIIPVYTSFTGRVNLGVEL